MGREERGQGGGVEGDKKRKEGRAEGGKEAGRQGRGTRDAAHHVKSLV